MSELKVVNCEKKLLLELSALLMSEPNLLNIIPVVLTSLSANKATTNRRWISRREAARRAL